MERDQASKFVNDLLRQMLARNGSDLFLTAEFPTAVKADDRINRVSPVRTSCEAGSRIDSRFGRVRYRDTSVCAV